MVIPKPFRVGERVAWGGGIRKDGTVSTCFIFGTIVRPCKKRGSYWIQPDLTSGPNDHRLRSAPASELSRLRDLPREVLLQKRREDYLDRKQIIPRRQGARMEKRSAIVITRIKRPIEPPFETEEIEISVGSGTWGAVYFSVQSVPPDSNLILSPDEATRIAIQLLEAARIGYTRTADREHELAQLQTEFDLLAAEYAEAEAEQEGKLARITQGPPQA